MIKANEFRVGNWVEDINNDEPNEIVKVSELKVNDFRNYINNASEEFYNPIPLTPEILEKAGFVQQNDTYDWSLGYKFQTNSEFILISRNDTFYYIDAINNEIKYLHQLQNLFFALVGEELTINF